ncbi:BON domain-containing protein [Mesorhizobium sp. INR15]|uniref:BON domain-containing protein n=1 Tax=Mesorhizobium sp. INR15 TaxID=2654248 RepID=UPI00189680AE|nr:BON domain-containing protein [Mesorhizobium sp. INR15]QPC91623.1 BON domain-containing protein [Mesorhizobium sp. INR15]
MNNDKRLKDAVLAELNWEPSVNAPHIGVTAKDGVVTLSGHVESYVEKRAAESAAKRVKGVKAVAEEIKVQLPFELQRGDEAIASAAIDRIAWDVSVPKDAVQIKVENGWVTLTGQVGWHYQQLAAEHDVRGLHGVVGVFNQTTLKPRVNTSDLSDDIEVALNRSWFFEPNRVDVSADEGKVRLSGAVHSWHERQVAESTAWAAPGATSVENNISII